MTSQELSFTAQKLASMIEQAKSSTDKIVLRVEEAGFKMWNIATMDRSGRYAEDKPAGRRKGPAGRISYGVGLELIRNGRWREWVTPYGQTTLIQAVDYDAMDAKAKSNCVGSINGRG